jgi:hydrogenase maturation protease
LVSDDGVGIHAVRAVQDIVHDERVVCRELATANLDVLECLLEFDEAIIIDAARSDTNPPGSLSTYTLARTPSLLPSLSLHTIGLSTAFQLGVKMGISLPAEIRVFAIEVADMETFHEGCTDRVQEVLPEVVRGILRHLKATIPDLHVVSPKNGDDGCMIPTTDAGRRCSSYNITP